MLNLNTVKSYLTSVLPFQPSQDFIEELFLCSSSIEFEQSGEKLFTKGDLAKGFYWILSGSVVLELSPSKEVSLSNGDFVGFDNFMSQEPHHFSITTKEEKVQTIFIDRRCYNNLFAKRQNLSIYLLHQHLKQLILLKNTFGLTSVY